MNGTSIRNVIYKKIINNLKPNVSKNKFKYDPLHLHTRKFSIKNNDGTYSGISGGAYNRVNASNETNLMKEIQFEIKDTFVNYNTNSILLGKHINNYAKTVIFEVIKYYNNKHIDGNTDLKCRIIKYLNKVFSEKDLNYDKLMNKFNAQTTECLLGYMLLAFQNENLDLMLRTAYTYGRVLPMEHKHEWLDNYRLNAYGNAYNMIMWQQYDTDHVYTLKESPLPINKSVVLPFEKVLKYLVGTLRGFIIDRELYSHVINVPNKMSGGNIEMMLSSNNDTIKSKHKTAEEICDECYLHYPYYFGGSHGCDVFSLNMTLSIPEIKLFLDRYPSARVGYILNTATYQSGKGEHWVAMEFSKGKARLLCSQQSDFSVFHDNGVLRNSIHSMCFGEEWNNRTIQYDNENCGIFSAISLLQLLRFKSIDDAVDSIGINMKNLGHEIGKYSDVELVREKIAGVKI